MRPVGSVNGRTPRGGYPAVAAVDGGFLAGFLEGEACFQIRKMARGSSYGCALALSCRADDAHLVRDLVARTCLGSLQPKPARGRSMPQLRWNISAKSDCLRLAEILDRHPMRGRKSHEYAIWRAGVNWWIDGDPRARRPQRDWTPMAHLKSQLERLKRFEMATSPLIGEPADLFDDWGDFLSGFLTAECHLSLARVAPGRIRPRMSVHVRADDRELLEQLASRANVGTVNGPYRAGPGSSPSVIWAVVGLADLERITRVLDQHRLRGRKQSEYAIWKQAVAVRLRRSRGCEAALTSLRDDLTRARRYSGPID